MPDRNPTLPYNDVSAGTNLLRLFITFNIYVLNVLAFLTSICFRNCLWFSSNKSFYHSRIWQHPTFICVIFWPLRFALLLIANHIVKNKGTSTPRSLCSTLLYKGNLESIGFSLNPHKTQNGEECMLGREDHRFTTTLIFPQQVEYQSMRPLG